MNADYRQALKDCRRAMMNILARREHSAHELRQKAKDKLIAQSQKLPASEHLDYHLINDIADDALLQLQQDGLQSDERFTEIFIRARSEQLYGPQRIRAELHQKGVSHELIEQQMQESGVDWAWSLQLALDKKCLSNPATLDMAEQRKLMAYLARRGFDENDVRRICKHNYLD